jgi:hypothetical protein
LKFNREIDAMTPAAAETESPEESRPTAGPVKDRDAAEQLEIAALRKELAEQEALLDEHSSALVSPACGCLAHARVALT